MRIAIDTPLDVTFYGCDAGWIKLIVAPLTGETDIRATHLDDPFPAMLGWLEHIVSGGSVSRWLVPEEGCAAQLIYTAKSDRTFGNTDGLLVFMRSYDKIYDAGAIVIDQYSLVRTFYKSFMFFVRGSYDPEQWESKLPPDKAWEDLTDEEAEALYGWDGERLGELKSDIIEAFLSTGK